MSTDYGIICLDCIDQPDTHPAYVIEDERSPDTVAELVTIAPELATVRKRLPTLDLTVSVGYSRPLDLAWFEKHGKHKLDIIDEYGYRYPSCNRVFFSESDENRRPRYCKLKDDHRPGTDCSDVGVFGR